MYQFPVQQQNNIASPVKDAEPDAQDEPPHVTASKELVEREGGRGGYNGPLELPTGTGSTESAPSPATADAAQPDSPATQALKEVTERNLALLHKAACQAGKPDSEPKD